MNDLTVVGGLVQGVGRFETGALLFSLDPASGAVTDVRTSSGSLVVGSLSTTDLGVARVSGPRLDGVRFPAVGRLSFVGRSPVFAGLSGARVLGTTSTRLIELRLNDDLLGACSGAFGVPFADAVSPSSGPASLTVTSIPLSVVSTIVSMPQQPVGVMATSSCGL
ncbi:MAG: hypothetical protein Q8L14_28650 [Myxococcales bacterium]|nr:hypothetical protein [Myxococcales bacterium]